MPDVTPILSLPYIQPSQAQKHVTHNEALRTLDFITQLAVISRVLTSPPGSPGNGDRYVVATGATGAWAGQVANIAIWTDSSWNFVTPLSGWMAHVLDEDQNVVFDSTSGNWLDSSAFPFAATQVGINATADATNRLSLSAPATLLNHEGAGHQLKLNKASTADTASMLYQDGFSGRAEIGLTGDDDFHFKVSADGSTWYEAITLDKDNGYLSIAGISGHVPIYDTGGSVFIGEGAGDADDLSTNKNVFIGLSTGSSNTSGSNNTAVGTDAFYSNVTGWNNTAIGFQSLYSNTTGNRNLANGLKSLNANTTGIQNTANGYRALYANTTGSNNVASGFDAGMYTNAGASNLTSGASTYLGNDTRSSASGNTNETVIGGSARGNGSNTVTLGNGSITGAHVQVAWTITSDERDKTNFAPVPHGLDFIDQLRPTAFQYTDGRGGQATGPVRYGFKAQDILALEANPVLVDASNPDKLKLNETALIPVLVQAIQELTARIEKLESEIDNG